MKTSLTFFIAKKVSKNASQDDSCLLFTFSRFATKRELKLFWAHLSKSKLIPNRLHVLTGHATLRSLDYNSFKNFKKTSIEAVRQAAKNWRLRGVKREFKDLAEREIRRIP